MADQDAPQVKRLKGGRVECEVVFAEEQVKPAEEQAMKKLGKDVKIDGFREGAAPVDMLASKVDPAALFEETVHTLLPDTFKRLAAEHEIKPIIPPKIEVESQTPLKVKITFIEQPEVKLKTKTFKVEKKEPEVDQKELQKMIDYILSQHQASKEVDRPAKEGDRVTMDFWGEDEEKKEIEGIRSDGHEVVIGSKTLIPGFEDKLKGVKKGQKTDFTLTFPEKYHAEQLQGKPVTFHIEIKKIEEVDTPTLTDEFAKTVLKTESADAFKKQVEESMKQQEMQLEMTRRERQLFDAVREATKVEIAQELIDEEMRSLLEDLQNRLQQQGVAFEDYLKQTGKNVEEFEKEMKENAAKRVQLRFGMHCLIEEKEIDVSDDEMKQVIDQMLSQVPDDQRLEIAPAYAKGSETYEQLKWQKKLEKLIDELLK